MKSSHTNGPWETGSLMSQVITWREGRPVPMCIADCGTKYAPNYEDERCANARLIAAAPELLEACKLAIKMLEFMQKKDLVGFGTIEEAIRKAEGNV